MDTINKIRDYGIVPVVELENSADSIPLCQAMQRGGLGIAEITMRTDAALASIEMIAKELPEILVGAGTVLNKSQCADAVKAGARFIVTPGFDIDIVNCARDLQVPIIPGVATPTEIMNGLKNGITVFKFFPAGNLGGLKMIRALSGPFYQASFIPTGGVNAENLAEYLSNDHVLAVGGSWVCPARKIRESDWIEIEDLCRQACSTRDGMRSPR